MLDDAATSMQDHPGARQYQTGPTPDQRRGPVARRHGLGHALVRDRRQSVRKLGRLPGSAVIAAVA